MKCLRERPDIVQCRLRDLLHFFQIRAQGRAFRGVLTRAAQHRTDRRQDLAELIVEFAGNVPKSGFLCRDQFLRQIAALLGKFCQARKNLAITANQIQARHNNGDERCREKSVQLALNTIVNPSDAGGGLLLAFVVFHE